MTLNRVLKCFLEYRERGKAMKNEPKIKRETTEDFFRSDLESFTRIGGVSSGRKDMSLFGIVGLAIIRLKLVLEEINGRIQRSF